MFSSGHDDPEQQQTAGVALKKCCVQADIYAGRPTGSDMTDARAV